jgi:transcriptional regulator with XRE-family HTH domain
LLGVDQIELSELAGVGISTVRRIELASDVSGSARTLWKIQNALEAAGVEFIPGDDLKGPGVRLRRPDGAKPKGRARKG